MTAAAAAAAAASRQPFGTPPATPPSGAPRPMLMADLREQAAQVNWAQAHDDALALSEGRVTAGQLAGARQDNLQQAQKVMVELAQHESHYRVESVKRLDMYDDLSKEYVKYVKQRDEAAREGMVGSAGLMVIYSGDMVSHGLAAAGIPLAKFYDTIRGVGDKAVAAYDNLRPLIAKAPENQAGRGMRAPDAAPAGSLSPATDVRIAGSPAGGSAPATRPQAAAPPGTADRLAEEKIRAVTEPSLWPATCKRPSRKPPTGMALSLESTV